MNAYSKILWGMCSLAVCGVAQAALPTALYDNFNASPLLNPLKWFGGGNTSARANLENIRSIVSHPTLGNRLRLYSRGFGDKRLNSGARLGSNNLNFSNPGAITAIKASVWPMSATVQGCTGSSDLGQVRTRLAGSFFNTRMSISGDATNDVFAGIQLQRVSNSTDAPNVFRVVYFVSICRDSGCFNLTDLKRAEIGTSVSLGQKVILSLNWDKAKKSFIFGRDAQSTVYKYTVSDTSVPGVDFKVLQSSHYAVNCVRAIPPTAAMDAYLDDIYTNLLPASSATNADMNESSLEHNISGSDSSVAPFGGI